jgi:lipoyl(octanoyl) transferase
LDATSCCADAANSSDTQSLVLGPIFYTRTPRVAQGENQKSYLNCTARKFRGLSLVARRWSFAGTWQFDGGFKVKYTNSSDALSGGRGPPPNGRQPPSPRKARGLGTPARRRRYNRRVISVLQLGTLAYAEGLLLQQKLVDLRKAGEIGDTLLLLEHIPVITLGRNARAANVLASTEELAARGVEVFECDRGGDVTFHGPGQIVGYPIFDLRGFSRQPSAVSHQANPLNESAPSSRKTLGAVDYVRRLEEVLIRTCSDFGIAARRVPGLTGVWTDTAPEAKIAAIGVHISRSVTSHGFALNVNTDLSYFNLIVPCGIAAKPVTSIREKLGKEVDPNAVAQSLSRNFGSVFGQQMLWVESLDALLGQRVGVPMKVPEELRRLHGDDDLFLA